VWEVGLTCEYVANDRDWPDAQSAGRLWPVRGELRADGTALVTGPVTRGHNVRSVGAAGHVALPVARQPVVAIIPTGDEIRSVGSVLGPGEFTDTNSLFLAARASQAGAVPVVTDVQPDNPDVLAVGVWDAALSADLALVIAGSRRGRDDFTAAVLSQVGGLAVHGVAVRPGHPVLLGYVKPGRSGPPLPGGANASRSGGTVPAIGVPGYPGAAAAIFELFAAPLLAQLQGSLVPDRLPLHARLSCDWSSPPDVEDWVLVSLNVAGEMAGESGGGLVATPLAGIGQQSADGCDGVPRHRAAPDCDADEVAAERNREPYHVVCDVAGQVKQRGLYFFGQRVVERYIQRAGDLGKPLLNIGHRQPFPRFERAPRSDPLRSA